VSSSAKSAPAVGELALIELIRSRASANPFNILGRSPLKLGIGDDCAILAPPRNHEILVTTDLFLETRHFRRDWHSPSSIGHRTLARGLSDLAAMGATPLAAFLSLALPKSIARTPAWLNGFLDGLLTLAAVHRTPLAGGDTSESPSDAILADILLLGSARSGRSLRRSTARPGDLLYVTGSLGGAATELAALSANPKKFRRAMPGSDPLNDHPHLFPQPRLAVGQALLRRRLATACIDLSDGLSTDLNHLCEASSAASGNEIAAELDISLLPAHPRTGELTDLAQITAILHGGEDYELLFTARPSTKVPRSIAGVPISRIGRLLAREPNHPRMSILTGGEAFALQPQGWEHLK
jgi:thiamine-monophosphate kinase